MRNMTKKESKAPARFTLPGLTAKAGRAVVGILQQRLTAYTDLHLTLKHVHWNVVGPNFIGVHEMIDPQVVLVRGYADEAAERIAALGGSPDGTAAALADSKSTQSYPLKRANAQAHLDALDTVYSAVIRDNRDAIAKLDELDLVTQDMVIGHTAELEQFQWFIRAHLENSAGQLEPATSKVT